MAAENTKDIPDDTNFMRCMQEMIFYLPAPEDPDFAPGEFSPAQETESGPLILPCVIFSDVAEAFIGTAYDRGWVLRGFDWALWAQSDEAQAMCNDPSVVARAESMQLLCLITALIR